MNAYKNVVNFFLVLNIVLLSKTVFFGNLHEKEVSYIFVIITVFLLLFTRVDKKNLIRANVMLLLFGIDIIINVFQMDNGITLVVRGMIKSLLPISIITSYMTKEEFVIHYVNIICGFALISIIFVSIANFSPQYVEFLSSNIVAGDHPYKIFPLYTWGWNEIFKRNSGPFWEPGAFQGFINIAILLIIFYMDNIKKAKTKIIILIITLLTTQSTTGYIVFLMILVIFGFDIIRKFRINIILRCLVLVIIIASGIFIIASNNISNKLDESNQSTAIRSGDYKQSIRMIIEKPIFGYGPGQAKTRRELQLGISDNSNGLLSMVCTYGIIFSIYYIYRLIKGINIMFHTNNILKKICIVIIFIILDCTEGLIWLPFYLTFLFQWKCENPTEVNI